MSEVKSLVTLDWSKDLTVPPDEVRQMIAAFEAKMAELPQIDIPLKHHFSRGVYAREIFIPKGTLIIGKIHRHQNMNIVSAGEVSVLSIDGFVRLKAPATIVASPGVKRVIFAHEDTVWTTIHGTNETDLEKLEDEFIAKSYDELPPDLAIEATKIEGDSCPG